MMDFGMPQLGQQGPLAQPLQMPAPKKKGGMFGSGANIGNAISAAIFGALAARGNPAGTMGLQQLYAQRNRKREMETEAQQYQQRRDDGFQDWVRKQAYQAANPSPVNNDTVQDFNFWKGVLPPDQFQQYIQNKVNPPRLQFIQGVGLVDVSQAGGQAPTAPVGKLTPIDDGGPTPQASGGFPPSGY